MDEIDEIKERLEVIERKLEALRKGLDNRTASSVIGPKDGLYPQDKAALDRIAEEVAEDLGREIDALRKDGQIK